MILMHGLRNQWGHQKAVTTQAGEPEASAFTPDTLLQ